MKKKEKRKEKKKKKREKKKIFSKNFEENKKWRFINFLRNLARKVTRYTQFEEKQENRKG